METRRVEMSAEQAELLDELTQRLMREEDPRAMKVGALVMAFKFAPTTPAPLPSNVIEFPRDVWSVRA